MQPVEDGSGQRLVIGQQFVGGGQLAGVPVVLHHKTRIGGQPVGEIESFVLVFAAAEHHHTLPPQYGLGLLSHTRHNGG